MGPFEPIPSLASAMNQSSADATRQTIGIAHVLGQMQDSEARRYQMMAAKQAAEQKLAQQQAMQSLIQGIQDPNQRMAASFAPDEYAKSLLREPQKLEYFDQATGRKTFGWAKPGEQPTQIGGIEKKLLSPEEIANAAAAKGAEEQAAYPYKRSVASAGAPRQMTLVNAYTPASEEAQKDYMKGVRGTWDQLKNAPQALDNINKAKQLVPAAKGFMGPGGEVALDAAKFLNNRIGTSINVEGVKSAEELRSRIFFNIMENLKKMDAQPSQQQQMIMQEALGKLGTDPGALPRILDAYGDSVRQKVDIYNKDVRGATERGVKFPFDPVITLEPNSSAGGGRQVVRTGKHNGKTVVQYSDGSVEYQ